MSQPARERQHAAFGKWSMTTDSQKVDTSNRTAIEADTAGSAGTATFDGSDLNWQFFEASPDGVKILDCDGRLIFVNANGLRALEADFESIGSRKWIELWPQASRAEVEQAFNQARGGMSARFTALRPTLKGTQRWWDVVISPIKDRAGKIVNLMSISRDVSPSIALAETLQRSEQQFQALANNIAQLAWMADASGQLFWLNQRWLDYTGSSLETSLGEGWRVFHHPDHVARVVDKWKRCTSEGRVWEDLFPLRGTDGNYRWFLSRAMPVRNAAGEIELWCGTNTDVTEARHQSQRLRKLARIIELSHEAMLVREVGGGIELWNCGCEELFGYTKENAKAKSVFELLQPRNLPPPDVFDAQILENHSWSGEVHYADSDGADVWVDSRQELVTIGDKNFVLETNRDITERRQADQVRSLLVAELNHRVKNTLAVVQSIAAQTARSTADPKKFIARFNGRLQSLAAAHNILSDVSWSGAPIVELIKSQVSVMGADADRIRLHGEPVDLPAQTAQQLALILHELAANALQHGALSVTNGSIDIGWVEEDGGQPRVRLTWREIGGPEVSPPVGRGFGLTLIERSRSLPNLMTSIAFEPQGVVVEILLDVTVTADQPMFNPGAKLIKPRQTRTRTKRAPERRIIIMDGSLSRAVLLEDMIDSAGYAVSPPITTAKAAIAELAAHPADLVALDVDEIADAEIDRLLVELEERRIPCIAIGSSGRLARIKAGSFSSLVAKPIERESFLRALRTSLEDDLEADETLL
jgi:PAS domain S-box-containing protein